MKYVPYQYNDGESKSINIASITEILQLKT
jgi:hypothetical protein